jgi:hypothetical protein
MRLDAQPAAWQASALRQRAHVVIFDEKTVPQISCEQLV